MFSARPLNLISLAGRTVLTCRVLEGNPSRQLDKELSLLTSGGVLKPIRVLGMSTAHHSQAEVFDLHIAGDVVEQSDLGGPSLLTDESGEADPSSTGGEIEANAEARRPGTQVNLHL